MLYFGPLWSIFIHFWSLLAWIKWQEIRSYFAHFSPFWSIPKHSGPKQSWRRCWNWNWSFSKLKMSKEISKPVFIDNWRQKYKLMIDHRSARVVASWRRFLFAASFQFLLGLAAAGFLNGALLRSNVGSPLIYLPSELHSLGFQIGPQSLMVN